MDEIPTHRGTNIHISLSLILRLNTIQKKLLDEVEINKALLSNHSKCETTRKSLEEEMMKSQQEKEAQINDLQEQVRDLMIHMESQQTIANSELREEIVSGTMGIQERPETSSRIVRRKKK